VEDQISNIRGTVPQTEVRPHSSRTYTLRLHMLAVASAVIVLLPLGSLLSEWMLKSNDNSPISILLATVSFPVLGGPCLDCLFADGT
jgi:hypothetical protein